jgi:hypothetical protein
MTEHVVKSLIEYNLGFHALEEYKESDTHLSIKLADKLTPKLQEMRINDCEVFVSDEYPTDNGDPHYWSKIKYGENAVDPTSKMQLSLSYSANDETGHPVEGLIKVIVKPPIGSLQDICRVLETEALEQYKKQLDVIYIGWKTTYDPKGPQFTKLSD